MIESKTPPPAPHPMFAGLEPYAPGEQPQEPGFIKLNTNEFPYPAAPAVIEAIRAAANDNVRLYPSPRCAALRRTLADFHGVDPEMIFVGNGSDEVLRVLIQGYGGAGRTVAVAEPSYSLYPVLTSMAGAATRTFDLVDQVALPETAFEGGWDMFLLPVPNAPLGTVFPKADLDRLAGTGGLVVLDEAYIDFADGLSHFDLLKKHGNMVLSRTFSKAYGLAGLRVGYAIADPRVIEILSALADSYNVNRITQAVAQAAIESADYYKSKIDQICADRDWLIQEMRGMGLDVGASAANFIFARHPKARELYEGLKAKKILIRYFNRPGLDDGLRITIGMRGELEAMLGALKTELNS